LPRGTVDVYLGGHTHSQMRHVVNGVPAAQSAPFSREFSTVEIFIDRRARRVLDGRTIIRPPTMICAEVYRGTDHCDPRMAPAGAALEPRFFEGHRVARDARVQAVIDPFLEHVADRRNQPLGLTATAPFTRTGLRESELGNLLADALREWSGADIAFMNSGGIRSNLRAGDLIYADIFEVSPFDNYPAIVTMTGAEVIESLRATSGGDRGLLQVSGLRYTIDASRDADKPPSQRNRVTAVTLANGEPVDRQKLYTVIMPDFLAYGGDGLAVVMNTIPPERIEIGQERPVRDVIIEALQRRNEPLTPLVEGRITIVNAPAR
ncbi:MAG TPA: 5'-nucleotidase, partial [Thermoanaerobaculia bacterium]|nr:5'-nucleotidase [Thermoanaerobaculia bacterium]